MPQRNLVLILLVAILALACYRATDHNPSVRMFQRALGEITQNYVEEEDENKLVEAAIRGMVGELHDQNSDFVSPKTASEMQMGIRQQFGGIGVRVDYDQKTQQLTVNSPMVGTPAFEAGLLAGDRIVEVDNKTVTGMAFPEAVELIHGRPGTPVEIKIERKGQEKPLSFKITRAIINVDSVFGDTHVTNDKWSFSLESDPDITYARIGTFGERTLDELKAVLVDREQHGAIKALILDLRDNPGGLLDSAVGICKLFVNDGTIVNLHGREGTSPRVYAADGTAPYTNFPIVVLVNRNSASASEIVASCLQDHGRAAIAGERSYGKGTVQNVIGLEGGHTLKLTTAHYYRPSGKNIHRKNAKNDDDWGVQPNEGLEVKPTEDELIKLMIARRNRDLQKPGKPLPGAAEAEEPVNIADEALNKAVEYLHRTLDAKKPAAKTAA